MLQRPWRFFRRSAGGDGFDPAVGFALLTGVMIASYSAVDRVGTRLVEPWFYAGLIWACLYVLPLVVGAADRRVPALAGGRCGGRGGQTPEARFNNRRAAVGGLITLGRVSPDPRRVQRRTADPPSPRCASRRSVIASAWGTLRLGEGGDRGEAARRITASVFVVLGAILLALDG